MAKHYLEVGVELASLGDDLGTQGGLLMSPKIVNEFLVPEYRRIFKLYKENDVLIGFHSCGHIEPLLEMFMALGVDILNPVQATANNLESIRRATQGRMALQGGISSGLIMAGPPEAIKEEAILRMRQLGKDGGYFCRPDQGMPWPPGHREALIEAIEEFGQYPL